MTKEAEEAKLDELEPSPTFKIAIVDLDRTLAAFTGTANNLKRPSHKPDPRIAKMMAQHQAHWDFSLINTDRRPHTSIRALLSEFKRSGLSCLHTPLSRTACADVLENLQATGAVTSDKIGVASSCDTATRSFYYDVLVPIEESLFLMHQTATHPNFDLLDFEAHDWLVQTAIYLSQKGAPDIEADFYQSVFAFFLEFVKAAAKASDTPLPTTAKLSKHFSHYAHEQDIRLPHLRTLLKAFFAKHPGLQAAVTRTKISENQASRAMETGLMHLLGADVYADYLESCESVSKLGKIPASRHFAQRELGLAEDTRFHFAHLDDHKPMLLLSKKAIHGTGDTLQIVHWDQRPGSVRDRAKSQLTESLAYPPTSKPLSSTVYSEATENIAPRAEPSTETGCLA